MLFHYLLLWQWEVCYQQGREEAREIVARNKAQGFCIPTPCCFWWIILPLCFRLDWALSVWTGLWRMESDVFRAGTDNSWLLTLQGSCCSLPICSLTGWWVGLSHILQWVKSSVYSQRFKLSPIALEHPSIGFVRSGTGEWAHGSSAPATSGGRLGTREPRPAPLSIDAPLLLLQWWLLCSALYGRTQRFLL